MGGEDQAIAEVTKKRPADLESGVPIRHNAKAQRQE
jgi:hypothetical protein